MKGLTLSLLAAATTSLASPTTQLLPLLPVPAPVLLGRSSAFWPLSTHEIRDVDCKKPQKNACDAARCVPLKVGGPLSKCFRQKQRDVPAIAAALVSHFDARDALDQLQPLPDSEQIQIMDEVAAQFAQAIDIKNAKLADTLIRDLDPAAGTDIACFRDARAILFERTDGADKIHALLSNVTSRFTSDVCRAEIEDADCFKAVMLDSQMELGRNAAKTEVASCFPSLARHHENLTKVRLAFARKAWSTKLSWWFDWTELAERGARAPAEAGATKLAVAALQNALLLQCDDRVTAEVQRIASMLSSSEVPAKLIATLQQDPKSLCAP
ncbi:MAG TPA: hypothetical protein VGC41_00035 [Kofleriaceae bacterium]